jgi:hypothetical protein
MYLINSNYGCVRCGQTAGMSACSRWTFAGAAIHSHILIQGSEAIGTSEACERYEIELVDALMHAIGMRVQGIAHFCPGLSHLDRRLGGPTSYDVRHEALRAFQAVHRIKSSALSFFPQDQQHTIFHDAQNNPLHQCRLQLGKNLSI